MTDQVAQEPTMEEILASIRRIISEDDAPSSDAPAPASEPEGGAAVIAAAPEAVFVEEAEDDVLDLTHPMDAADDILAPSPISDLRPSAVETLGDLDAYIAPPRTTRMTPIPAPAPKSGGLLTERTAASVSSAFGQLNSAMAMPAAGRTLEDVVRELLQPVLKEWLEANLPRIVEIKVAEEVERLARQR